MDKLYNVYYAGQVLDGHDVETVRVNLAKLFNANDKTLEKLFSGDLQLLKRDCNADQAKKYKAAMERAGALPIIRTLSGSGEDNASSVAPTDNKSSTPQTAAEKIAALASAPDETSYRDDDGNTASAASRTATEETAAADNAAGQSASPATEPEDESGLNIAPAGADVLAEHERSQPVSANIDTSELSVDETAQRLSEESAPPPPSPDVSHMEMGEVGEEIPTLESDATPLNPDTSGIDLSPEGTDFSDCQPEEATAPDVDLSGMEVAPEGSEVLEEKYRRGEEAKAPATDHISLQD
jgi:hypothetical protein